MPKLRHFARSLGAPESLKGVRFYYCAECRAYRCTEEQIDRCGLCGGPVREAGPDEEVASNNCVMPLSALVNASFQIAEHLVEVAQSKSPGPVHAQIALEVARRELEARTRRDFGPEAQRQIAQQVRLAIEWAERQLAEQETLGPHAGLAPRGSA